jgi:hypothetical protein
MSTMNYGKGLLNALPRIKGVRVGYFVLTCLHASTPVRQDRKDRRHATGRTSVRGATTRRRTRNAVADGAGNAGAVKQITLTPLI